MFHTSFGSSKYFPLQCWRTYIVVRRGSISSSTRAGSSSSCPAWCRCLHCLAPDSSSSSFFFFMSVCCRVTRCAVRQQGAGWVTNFIPIDPRGQQYTRRVPSLSLSLCLDKQNGKSCCSSWRVQGANSSSFLYFIKKYSSSSSNQRENLESSATIRIFFFFFFSTFTTTNQVI